ncbi:MAG: hypothetical protein ABIS45_04175 [Burkholderiales bacterium]
MEATTFRYAATLAVVASLLAACISPKSIDQPAQSTPTELSPTADQATEAEPQAVAPIAPLANGLPAKPLPPVQRGAMERFDCLTGTPDWHARIAFEARDGQVLGFAYYSKWRPRTCSIDLMRNAAGSKWHTAADGAVRVDTPQGRFHIRTRAEAYEFEFEHVQRRKFCGMPGEINGTMTIKRGPRTPQCSATGIMDTNDPYLDHLYKSKR